MRPSFIFVIFASGSCGLFRTQRTYPGLFPVLHLDHIYYEGKLEVVGVPLPRTRLSLVASDHLPLVADIRIG